MALRRLKHRSAIYANTGSYLKHRSAIYANPGPYWQVGNFIAFENGRKYRVDRATQRQASRYLTKVKEAEDAGKRIPRGPDGLTPAAAAVLLHFGRPKAKHRKAGRKATRKAVCKPCGPRKRRISRKTVHATVRRMARASKPAPRPVRATPRQQVGADQWNFIAETYAI